jgi:hypothetical protein
VVDQAAPSLAENPAVSQHVLNGQFDTPAEEQVIRGLLDKVPLTVCGGEHLQQHHSHELGPYHAEAYALRAASYIADSFSSILADSLLIHFQIGQSVVWAYG